MSRQVRLFRGLLRIYPASFRAEYADEMTRLFAEQLDDARRSTTPLGALRLWVGSVADLLLTAPGHHFRTEEPMPRPVDVGPAHGSVQPTHRPQPGPMIALGLLPLWLWAFFAVLAPGFMEPAFLNPPAILGLPLGLVIFVVALVWAAVGVFVLWRTASTVAALFAFLVFTVPSTFMVFLTPALVLVFFNLGA